MFALSLAGAGLLWGVSRPAPEWMFLALVLSTTSVDIVVPTLKERGLTSGAFGQIVLACAILADLLTMFGAVGAQVGVVFVSVVVADADLERAGAACDGDLERRRARVGEVADQRILGNRCAGAARIDHVEFAVAAGVGDGGRAYRQRRIGAGRSRLEVYRDGVGVA